MAHTTRRSAILGALVIASLSSHLHAAENPVYSNGGIAINGYDPVAYFTQGKPVAGIAGIEAAWNGATWLFSSEANKALFVSEPEKYAPQYGGYCAYAVSKGYTAKTDPAAFTVRGGKLYLNYSAAVAQTWLGAVDANIASGDANWPGLTKR